MQRHIRHLLPALLALGPTLGLILGLGGATHHAGAATPAGHEAWAAWRQTTLPAGLAPAVALASPGLPAIGRTTTLTGATWAQQAELTSTAQSPNDAYGSVVALSGNTAAIGAQDAPGYPSPPYGAVYIVTRTSSGGWSQQADLLDPGYGGPQPGGFGQALALQGNTLAVGAPGAHGGLGGVYVYGRTGGAWTQQALVTPTDATQPENFGLAVALSGNTLVVGADCQNNCEGAVYIYAYSNGTWRPQAELTYPGRYLFANFGANVAAWGNTAVVTAPQAQAAFVYARSGTTWRLQSLLTAPHAPRNFFGESVALQGDTALVGACCALTGNPNGAVYVFTRSGSTWSLQTTLRSPGGINDSFGSTVSLSYHTAVVGNSGAYVFVGSGATWSEQAQLIPIDRPPQDVGYAVAVQGNTALVGGTNVNGTAYVFTRSGAAWAADGAASQAVPWRR